MAVMIKCKMCGGDLALVAGSAVATCEYCGSVQTVPSADSDKKLTLFGRANRLRAACDFDKAAGIYESIVADFPEEAEAYWGLVLCKYGIEYVDDPATGKKIPTCHRSSFDSVMDDGNLEQALENAELTAQRVYREEAKEIERIRKGILEVSSKESPYDIFICYKETDEHGDRTLDSVLAQDLYTALTDKGYRVFFSRITLKGKLGEAFEPYIFAALNSAKVMLAVGSCYEYYNAVWVKNEWSRYLKLCQADKNKHLIPCYKNLDPEDMPREFNHLQGADLGQMGAIQDILANMEKYIPLKKNTTVIQERVVVGGSGNNKIASLLDRGNMALEDGDWAKADSFFEDVLNNDSKNAQAYLGKTLAMEKCRTIDAFARKRKDASQNVRGEKLELQPNYAHVDEMVERFSLPGYVEQNEIRKLYDFDLSYHSDVAERKQQYRNEEKYWADHKQLSRAEKFAAGAVAEHLTREKQALFAALADRIKQAEMAEAAGKKDVQSRYEAYLTQADGRAEKLYEDGIARREKTYQTLLLTAKNSSDIEELKDAAGKFDALGDYKDSKDLARHCRNRAAEEQAKLDAAAEAERLAREQAEAARKAKNKKIGIISAIAAAVVIAVALIITQVVIPGNNYQKAQRLLAEGENLEAAQIFTALGDYKDAADRAMEAWDGVVTHNTVAAAQFHTVAIKNDGTVVAVGEDGNDQCAVEDWTDIISVAASTGHTVGLKADGTVVATGDDPGGRCNVSEWTQIVDIAAGYEFTLGLKADGTVLVAGTLTESTLEVNQWTDIVDINAEAETVCGKTADGNYLVTGQDDTPACVQADVGSMHVVYLTEDGTVTAYGHTGDGKCATEGWTDILAVAAGWRYTLGLKTDGTVVATKLPTDDWDEGQCNVLSWTDIVGIYSGGAHSIGLKADGTVVATGANNDGQCDVGGWSDIRLPQITAEQRAAMDASREEKAQALADAYNAAVTMMDEGDYAGAMEAFAELGQYNDSAEQLVEAQYQQALALIGQESYTEAYDLLAALEDYKDTADYLANYRHLPVYACCVSNSSTKEFYITYDQSGKMTGGYRDAFDEKKPVYSFDEKGVLIREEWSNGTDYDFKYHSDGTVEKIPEESICVKYYDRYGNMTGYISMSGEHMDYTLTYDDHHNESSKYAQNTYDENGNLVYVYYRMNNYVCESVIEYEVFYLTDVEEELAWKNFRMICGDDIW